MSERDHQTYRIYDARGLGHAVRNFRQAEGLTQAELAERTGISRDYIIDIEQGAETEQLRRIFRLLRQLNLSITVERRNH